MPRPREWGAGNPRQAIYAAAHAVLGATGDERS